MGPILRKSRDTRVRWLGVLGLLFLGVLASPVDADQMPALRVEGGRVRFDGRASLGDFTGESRALRGLTVEADSLPGVTGWVEVVVDSFTTGNGRRDRDLRKSLESATFPVIRFDLAGVAVRWQRGDSAGIDLHGRLVLHGVTRDLILTSTLLREGGDYQTSSTFPLNLKDYRIGGLSKMFGLFKMQEDIVVHLEIRFRRDDGLSGQHPKPAVPGDHNLARH